MDTHTTDQTTQQISPARRKFVLHMGVLSLIAAAAAAVRIPVPAKKNIIACKPEKKSKKIKMLAQDGSLVEVDASLLSANRKKISDQELQHWIKK